jgi:MFS family permease
LDNKPTATVGITAPGVKKNEPLPLRRLLIPRVLIAALNYACLALVDIATRAIQPVFFSTPIELGGLGLPPHHIGKILSIYGILNGFLQIFCFAKIHARFGSKNVYIAGIASSLLVFVSFPVINHLARAAGGRDWLVWLAVGFQIIVSIFINFSYGKRHWPTSLLQRNAHRFSYLGCVFIYITASSPNRASLGSVNGLAQFSVSIVRAIGPAAANSLFSLSIDPTRHYLGGYLVYWAMSCLTCLAIVAGLYLPKKVWGPEDEDESR